MSAVTSQSHAVESPPERPVAKPWPLPARLAIIGAMVLSAVIAAPVLRNLRFEEDVTNWLPAEDPQARLLDWHRRHFPSDPSVLVAWEGATLGDERIEKLAASLREADWVKTVVTPNELIGRMTESRVPPEVARQRIRGLLLGEPNENVDEIPAGLAFTFTETDEKITLGYFRDVASRAQAVGIPPEALHLGGGEVASTELDRRLSRTRWNPDAPWYRLDQRSPLALTAIVALVLAIALVREVRLTVLVLGVTLYATMLGVAVLPATGTPMNMVLTVLSPLLLVLTLSATIHVANYWRHAATRTTDRAASAATARKVAFWPCVLAGVTTAIGLVSLLTSPLRPVRDFGLYSAIGVLIGLVAALYGLPALLSVVPTGTPLPPGKEASGWARIGRTVSKHATLTSVICLAIGIFSCFGLRYFRTETRVISYFPSDSPIVADYNFLERHLAGITPLDIVVTFDDEAKRRLPLSDRVEIVRSVENAVRQHPDISGTMALPDFLPEPSDLNLGGRAEFRRRLTRLEDSIVAGDEPEVARFVRIAETPFVNDQLQAQTATGDEIWQVGAQVSVMSNPDFGAVTSALETGARTAIGDEPGVDFLITGTVPLFLRTQQGVLDSLIVSFGIAFVVIAVVLMIVLRSFWAGLLTMLPNLLPVVVVFGLISWMGQTVDIGMMITASVALGIAVDGTLHLLTWYREGLGVGRTPAEAVSGALAHCGPAMWQTSGIIGFALLMLAFSDLLLISRFGWLMASLIFAALIADLVFLPALLCGRLGRLLVAESPPPVPQP